MCRVIQTLSSNSSFIIQPDFYQQIENGLRFPCMCVVSGDGLCFVVTPLLLLCLLSSVFKQRLLPQVKEETDRDGRKEEEVISKCPAEGQHPPTPTIPLLLLHHFLFNHHCPLFAHVANPSPLHPAPSTRPQNEPWTWTRLVPRSTQRTLGKPAEGPETTGSPRVQTWTESGRVWLWSSVPVAAGRGRRCTRPQTCPRWSKPRDSWSKVMARAG